MKQACKISVTSTRHFHAVDFLPSLKDGADEWQSYSAEDAQDVLDELFSEGENEAATSTLTAFGVFSAEKDGSYRISYEDSEITGLKGCLTTFCLAPTGMLILLRRGEVRTCMVFEKGARHLCDYGLEGNLPSVVLHTHRLESDLTAEGGYLFVDYSVEIRGTRAEHNELFIEVKTKKKEEV